MRSRFLLLVLAFLLSVPGLQAPVSATGPETGWPHDKSDLKPDPRLTFGTLDNGLRYVVMQNATPEGEGVLRLWMDVGSLKERADEQGFAHYVEHMAFNGTKNLPEGDFIKTIERLGFSFGADANAYTGYDETVYKLDLPNLKAETLDTAFLIMREIAGNVLFEADAVDRERGVVLSEYRLGQTVQAEAGQAERDFLFPGMRVADYGPIGTEKTLDEATAKGLKDFYQTFYRPERALVVMVADMAPDDMIARIRAAFSDWQATAPVRDLAYMADPLPAGSTKPEAAIHVAEGLGNAVKLVWVGPHIADPDNSQTRRTAYLRSIALGVLGRRFDRLSTDSSNGILGAGPGYYSFYGAADVRSFGAAIKPELWQTAVKTLTTEFRRAYDHGFTEAEIAEVVANMRLQAEHGLDTEGTSPSGAWANWILSNFAGDNIGTSAADKLAFLNAALDGLTPDQVHAAFREVWKDTPPKLFLVAGKGFDATAADLDQAYADAAALAVDAPEDRGEAKFAYTDFGTPGTVVSRTDILDGKATEVRFANNVRLTLMHTDFEKASIYGTLRFGGGQSAMTPESGAIRYLYNSAFSNGGLEAHDRNALVQLLAGKTAGMNSDVRGLAYQFNAGFRPDDMLLQMQLWAAYLTAPGYRDEALDWFRRGLKSGYEQLLSTPGGVAGAYGSEIVYGKDYRFILPPREALESLDMEQLKALIDADRETSAIEIALVGDLDVDAAIDAVARTLGALPMRAGKIERNVDAMRIHMPAPETRTLYHKGSAEQALLQINWPTDDNSDPARTAALNVLADVLQARMRDKVREEMGAAYAPSVGHSASSFIPHFGIFSVRTDAKPAELSLMQQTIMELVTGIGAVTEDEITRAREPGLAAYHTGLMQNSYWLAMLGVAQSEPARLTMDARYFKALEAVTPADVEAVAAKYLLPERARILVVLPESLKAGAGAAPASGR